jgi:hypothetical protein
MSRDEDRVRAATRSLRRAGEWEVPRRDPASEQDCLSPPLLPNRSRAIPFVPLCSTHRIARERDPDILVTSDRGRLLDGVVSNLLNAVERSLLSPTPYLHIQQGVSWVSGTKEQHIVDDQGQRVAVVLPLEEYEQFQEDLHDLAVAAERRDEPTMGLAELKKRLG